MGDPRRAMLEGASLLTLSATSKGLCTCKFGGNPRSIPEGPLSLTYSKIEGLMCPKFGGNPTLDVRRIPGPTYSKSKLDVLQIWGDNPRSMFEGTFVAGTCPQPPRSMCCKIRATRAQCPDGASSLTDARWRAWLMCLQIRATCTQCPQGLYH